MWCLLKQRRHWLQAGAGRVTCASKRTGNSINRMLQKAASKGHMAKNLAAKQKSPIFLALWLAGLRHFYTQGILLQMSPGHAEGLPLDWRVT